jgi:hypothetical protein
MNSLSPGIHGWFEENCPSQEKSPGVSHIVSKLVYFATGLFCRVYSGFAGLLSGLPESVAILLKT